MTPERAPLERDRVQQAMTDLAAKFEDAGHPYTAALIREALDVASSDADSCACGGYWRGAVDGPYIVCAVCGATKEDAPYA